MATYSSIAAAEAANAGAARSALFRYQIRLTASGPRLVERDHNGSSWVDVGSERAPDAETNAAKISSWGTDQVTFAGGVDTTVGNNYFARWQLVGSPLNALIAGQPWFNVMNFIWTFPGSDARLAAGVFRASAGSFTFGAANGMALDGGSRKQLRVVDNNFGLGGFYTLMVGSSSAVWTSYEAVPVVSYNRDIKSNGASGTRPTSDDTLATTEGTGNDMFLYLIGSGTDALTVSGITIDGTMGSMEKRLVA